MRITSAFGLCVLASVPVLSQAPPMPMPIEFQNSAEFGWLNKKVLESRLLDGMADPNTWSVQGQAKLTFPPPAGSSGMRALRVEMEMFRDQPAPTLTFKLLYCFFVIDHGRRKILHFNVTRHPTAELVVQQLREAFPEAGPYRYVNLDRDSKFDADVITFLKATGLKPKRTSFQRHAWRKAA